MGSQLHELISNEDIQRGLRVDLFIAWTFDRFNFIKVHLSLLLNENSQLFIELGEPLNFLFILFTLRFKDIDLFFGLSEFRELLLELEI